MRQQFIYDFETGIATMKVDGKEERVVCYDIKIELEHSLFRCYFWPKKKSDRKKAISHYKENGIILGDLNAT